MAKATDDGCRSYEERWVNLFFEEGHVCCKYCQLLQTYSRAQCMKTGELIVDTNVTGYWCPLLKADDKGQIVSQFGEVVQT